MSDLLTSGLRALADAIDETMADNSQEVIRLQAEVAELLAQLAELRRQAEEDNVGWIEWRGGERPVHGNTNVEIKLRGFAESYGGMAMNLNWNHWGLTGDIVAYRVVEEAPVSTADDDGWIEWHGGERPVTRNMNVEVKLRDFAAWRRGMANTWRWRHWGDASDIVAYRVIEEEKE